MRPDSGRSTHKRLWLYAAAVWQGVALLSVSGRLAQALGARDWGAASRLLDESFRAGLAYAAATGVIWWAGMRWPVVAGLVVRRVVTHAIGFSLACLTLTGAHWALLRIAPLTPPAPFRLLFAGHVFGALVTYAVVLLVQGHLAVRRQWEEQRVRAAQLEADLARAQLQVVTGQMRPHFLFNALNAVTALVRSDHRAAERLLLDLASILRESVDRAAQPTIMLQDELAFLRRYVTVMAARIGRPVRFTAAIDDALTTTPIPSFLLLPIVENALVHGLMPARRAGEVHVSATTCAGALDLRVADDGQGMPAAIVERIGLTATRRRLMAHFGVSASLTFGVPPSGTGTEARLTLPLGIATVPMATRRT